LKQKDPAAIAEGIYVYIPLQSTAPAGLTILQPSPRLASFGINGKNFFEAALRSAE